MDEKIRERLLAVAGFLAGELPLDGVWFGEKHPTERGAFWWRKHLREALAALSAPEPAREAWSPMLSDRADGVSGHYAIVRWNPAGYREVWNLRSHEWASASDEVLTLDEATRLLQSMRPSSKAEPAREYEHPLDTERLGPHDVNLTPEDQDAAAVREDMLTAEPASRVGPEPFCYIRFIDGEPDWAEDCIGTSPCDVTDNYPEATGNDDEPQYEARALYLAPPPSPEAVPEVDLIELEQRIIAYGNAAREEMQSPTMANAERRLKSLDHAIDLVAERGGRT